MNIKLLGNGAIFHGDEEIVLSFKKAYALLFYLLMEKSTTREHIVNLLWGELTDDSAKKNLRNAVYVIRKTCGDQIILSPKRDILKINEENIDWIDVNGIENLSRDEILELHEMEFLNGFHLKDAPYFDEWLTIQRYHFKEKLVKRIKHLAEVCLEQSTPECTEQLSRKLLYFDSFDESAYRLLFRALEMQGKYSAVADAYNELCETLNEELMLKPDDSTKFLFEEIMMVKSREESVNDFQIYGRVEEINLLKASLYGHIKTAKGKSTLLMGESGIGKTTILSAFNDQIEDQHTVLQGRCYKAEVDFPLSPWFALLESMAEHVRALPKANIPESLAFIDRLTDNAELMLNDNNENLMMNSYRVEKIIFELFDTLLQHKRIVLLFEDIQWMDKLSLKLLAKLMHKPIFIVASVNTDYTSRDWHLNHFVGIQSLTKLPVEAFSKIETFEFIESKQGHAKMSIQNLEKVYEESRGNPLFISEMLNAYDWTEEENSTPGRVVDVMQMRFAALSRDEQKILNIASNFYDHFNYDDLKSISGMDEFIILDVLGQLVKKHMLEEVTKGEELVFTYSHNVFREFVYHDLPLSVRRVYHLKIGQYLEKTSSDNPSLNRIYRMLYNFSMAGDQPRELKYRIQFVTDYFNISHEMFPVVGSHIHNDSEYSSLVDVNEIHKEINRMETLYQAIEPDITSTEAYDFMTLNYLRQVGRYYNIKGQYEKAYDLISKMYDKAKNIENDQYTINALLLLIHYYINVRDLEGLDQALNSAFVIANKMDSQGTIGILLRLKGYSKILEGRFEIGIKILRRAISVFKSLEQKESYTLNIVGAHYYIGEGFRFKGDLSEAMDEYNFAIDLCKTNGYSDKLAFLYGALGQVYYELDKFDAAKTYLEEAKQLYERVEGAWGRTITMGYYSLVLLRAKRYKETLKIIKHIDECFDNVVNPYHRALIYRIKGEICYLGRDSKINNKLFDYITCEESKYCTMAIESFSKLNSTYEMELMERMNALCSKCLNQF